MKLTESQESHLKPRQKLIFDQSIPVKTQPAKLRMSEELEAFYEEGFTLRSGFESRVAAESYLESFLSALDGARLPHFQVFDDRMRLAKVARIPSRECQDAIDVPYLALHFEMGLPLIAKEDRTVLYLVIALYCPHDVSPSETRTRYLSLKRWLKGKPEVSAEEIASRLKIYGEKFSDGWTENDQRFVSGRISCMGKVLDAVHQNSDLQYMDDYRIAEWFNADESRVMGDGEKRERDFFNSHGYELEEMEKSVCLKPGDLLILDNICVGHGRKGQREAEELYQYLYGVEDASKDEIDFLRDCVSHELLGQKK